MTAKMDGGVALAAAADNGHGARKGAAFRVLTAFLPDPTGEAPEEGST